VLEKMPEPHSRRAGAWSRDGTPKSEPAPQSPHRHLGDFAHIPERETARAHCRGGTSTAPPRVRFRQATIPVSPGPTWFELRLDTTRLPSNARFLLDAPTLTVNVPAGTTQFWLATSQ
ncbi:glycosyl hydrolase family 3 N terminal domain-containing protein, partial [Colletotrichum scovillei]